MNSEDLQCLPEHRTAVEWALGELGADHLETVAESGWSSTYRLSGDTGTAYLKVVPPVQFPSVRHALAVADAFADHVPPVIAAEPDRGWLLTADHGGEPVDFDDPGDDLLSVLTRYAAMQAEAAGAPTFLAALEPVDVGTVLDDLFAFLSLQTPAPSESDPHRPAEVGADYFIGASESHRYLNLLQARAHLLADQIARCAALPATLSHGDLHRWNVAIRPGGEVVFFDWDEAAIGPAGLSLHGLFRGCTRPTMVLDRLARSGPLPDSRDVRCLDAYVGTLVERGYASRDSLLAGLPGALCAGQIRFINRFGRYPGEPAREASGNTLRRKLSDLLDLCDWLCSRNEATASVCADDYEAREEWHRAHRLVQDRLARSPRDTGLLNRYAALSYRLGDLATADEAYRESIAIDASQPTALAGLARVHLSRMDRVGCAARLDEALAIDPMHPEALAVRARMNRFTEVLAAANTPEGLPRWAVTDAEHRAGHLDPDSLALLVDLFRNHGIVQVDNVFPPERIAALQHAFALEQQRYFEDVEHSDVLAVGDKRFMLTMTLDERFGAPDLVASDLLLPFMHRVLGKECILGAYTAVISLPGSEDQTIHKDHSELFEENGWLIEHPAFAAQIIIPLLALDEVTGATRMFKGSQRVPLRLCSDLPHQDPEVPLGSCILLDYSVAHLGRGNRSEQVRPILNLVYSRPWFRDCRNYHLQPPLRFAPTYLDDAPESIQKLVGWWELERRAAAHDDERDEAEPGQA